MKICYKIFAISAVIVSFATGAAKSACTIQTDASGNISCCTATCPSGTYMTADLCKTVSPDGCKVVATTGTNCYSPYTCSDITIEIKESGTTKKVSKLSSLDDANFDEMVKYYIGNNNWKIYTLSSAAGNAVYKYGNTTIKTATGAGQIKINNTTCYWLSEKNFVKNDKLYYLKLNGNTVLIDSYSMANIKTDSCFKKGTNGCQSGYYGYTIGKVDDKKVVLRGQNNESSYPTSSEATTSDPNKYIATYSELKAINDTMIANIGKNTSITIKKASGNVLWNDSNTCYWAIPDDNRNKKYPDVIVYAFDQKNDVTQANVPNSTGCYDTCPTGKEIPAFCGKDTGKSYNGMAGYGSTGSSCSTTKYDNPENDCVAPWGDMAEGNVNKARDVIAGNSFKSYQLKTLTNNNCDKYMKCKSLIVSILP